MDTLQLENQWKALKQQQHSDFLTLRIDEKCIPNINIGINSKKHRCLLLMLPPKYVVKFNGESKENLKTSYHKASNCIVLELLDEYYHSLFNDLIISLYFKIRDITDTSQFTSVFVSTINKWSDFLAKARNTELSAEVIKGLFGELSVLNELIQSNDKLSINSLLESWLGPYDTTTDFIFDHKNIEVKTKNYDSHVVTISSEHQLDDEPGKSLELLVVSVESGSHSTLTIESIVNQIRDRVLQLSGDISILFDALAQVSLFPSNLKEYNKYRFTLKSHDTYSCAHPLKNTDTFPRLIKTQLPKQLKNIKYNIHLQDLSAFIVSQQIF